MSKKLFIFDVDGTFIDSKKNILPSTIEIVDKLHNAGHICLLATGRCYDIAKPIFEQINGWKYLIGNSGVSLFNFENNQSKIHAYLDEKVVRTFLKYAQKYQREFGISDGIHIWNTYFGKNPFDEINDNDFFITGTPSKNRYKSFDLINEEVDYKKICQVRIKAEKIIIKKIYDEITSELDSNLCNIFESSRVYLEAVPNLIDKYYSIKKIQEMENITNENTYAFGDSQNDLSMLINVGNGVAMGNASEEVKKNAKFVTTTNNNDGIANFIKKLEII